MKRSKSRRPVFPRAFLLFCVFCLSVPLLAATAEPPVQRKKVGLVLSGGGARGAAHVGVIKVLERMRVPVDYIVGTSLGSVVGALYATGKTSDELEQIIKTIDWDRGFIDEVPRRRLPLRRKDEEDEFLINFELGVRNWALSLPRGVIQGHSLHLLLKSLLGGAALVNDFDTLPIPFRAIATNVEQSTTVVLREGDLAKSLQASMSIPGIYTPVLLDGELLVDGGVTNNLPVDIAREMGADVVIAVDISTPLADQESLRSVVDIVDQLTNILTRANVEERLKTLGEEDIYILPELSDYAASDFAKTPKIVRKGEQAALEVSGDLSRLALDPAQYESYRMGKAGIQGLPRRIGKVDLIQNSALADSLLLRRAQFVEGERFDVEQFHSAIDAIYASGVFERVDYFYSGDPVQPDITVEAIEKSWGPDVVRFGFTLEDDFGGNNNYNLSVGYTNKAINRLGGDIRVIGQIGETPRFLAEFFQPFDQQADYYALLAFDHQQSSRGAFSGDTQTGEFRLRRNQVGGYLGRQIGSRADFRAGLEFGVGSIRRRIGDVSLTEREDFTEGAVLLEFRHDSLDSIRFPSRGSLVRLKFESSLEFLNADEEYDSVSFEALTAYRRGTTRWAISSVLQTVTRNDVPVQKAFSQGSLLSTSGLKRNVEVGQHAGRVSLIVYRPLTTQSVQALETPVYLGGSLEVGRVFQERDEVNARNLQISGSVFVAADTPVGPLYLGIGGNEGEGVAALLSLGLTF